MTVSTRFVTYVTFRSVSVSSRMTAVWVSFKLANCFLTSDIVDVIPCLAARKQVEISLSSPGSVSIVRLTSVGKVSEAHAWRFE
jgi:hypothetical protein